MAPRKQWVYTVTRRDQTDADNKKGVANLLEVHATVESANNAAFDLTGDDQGETDHISNKGDSCDTYKNKTEHFTITVKKVELRDEAPADGQGAASGASAVSSTAKSTSRKSTTKKSATPKAPNKKTTQFEGTPGSLDGIKIIFTGTLSMDRKTCDATAIAHGAEVVPSAKIGDADYVVTGDRPGDKKLAEISEKGLQTLTEEEFIEMLGGQATKKQKL